MTMILKGSPNGSLGSLKTNAGRMRLANLYVTKDRDTSQPRTLSHSSIEHSQQEALDQKASDAGIAYERILKEWRRAKVVSPELSVRLKIARETFRFAALAAAEARQH